MEAARLVVGQPHGHSTQPIRRCNLHQPVKEVAKLREFFGGEGSDQVLLPGLHDGEDVLEDAHSLLRQSDVRQAAVLMAALRAEKVLIFKLAQVSGKFRAQAPLVIGEAAAQRLLDLSWQSAALDDISEVARTSVPSATVGGTAA